MQVLDGMFNTANVLFGITITAADGDTEVLPRNTAYTVLARLLTINAEYSTTSTCMTH
jgi:Zn-dependent oligopeptidase